MEITKDLMPISNGELEPIRQENRVIAKTSYITAMIVQKPRVFAQFVERSIQEAQLAEDSLYWAWEVVTKAGKKMISGPSIELAKILFRNFGNCAIEPEIQSENQFEWYIKATFIDLESGASMPALWRQSKSQLISENMGFERQTTMNFQKGISKAMRNAIIKYMPSWLINKMIHEGRKYASASIKAENPALARAQTLALFEKLGVTREKLEKYLEVDNFDNSTTDQLIKLREMHNAILEGMGNTDIFNGDKEDEKPIPEKSKPKVEPEKPKSKEKEDPVKTELSLAQKINKCCKVLANVKKTDSASIYNLFSPKAVKDLTEKEASKILESLINALGQEGIDSMEVLP